jgi:hypothetical protein
VISRLSELAGCKATSGVFLSTGDPSDVGLSCKESWIGQAPEACPSSLGLQLACLLEQVQSATTRAQRLVFGRPENELTVRVRLDSWSVAECLGHLALTTQVFLPPIAAIMAKTPRLTRNRSLRSDTLARVLVRILEPPYRLRHKSLAHLAPPQTDFRLAWKVFLDTQQELAQIIRSGVGLAIDTVKIQSPVCSRMSYTVYGALGVLSAHQRRHLWQAEQVLLVLDRRSRQSSGQFPGN